MTADSRRAFVIAFLVGGAVLVFLGAGIWSMGRRAAENALLEGVIVEKKFDPQAETQISVGSGGVKSREIAGIYRFIVRGDNGRDYTIFVPEPIYRTNREGDRFRFAKPGL